MIDRLLTPELIQWESLPQRKPLLLDGARQVGKTYLIEQCFGGQHFKKVIKLDFLANPQLVDIFRESLDPEDILLNIQIIFNASMGSDSIDYSINKAYPSPYPFIFKEPIHHHPLFNGESIR